MDANIVLILAFVLDPVVILVSLFATQILDRRWTVAVVTIVGASISETIAYSSALTAFVWGQTLVPRLISGLVWASVGRWWLLRKKARWAAINEAESRDAD